MSDTPRNEIPAGTGYVHGDGRGSLVDTRGMWDAHHIFDNEYEALMQADWNCEPGITKFESDLLGVDIELWMSCLTPKEQAVIELVVFGQMSLSEAGWYLALQFRAPDADGVVKPFWKSTIAKYRDVALKKLRAHIGELNG